MREVREILGENKIIWISLLALVFFSLFRTNVHIDEARYLSVAWEMGFRNEYIVPYLNGEAYSHKPPLLFWITNLLWSATGPQLWAARLIPPLFIIGTAILIAPLSRALFPHQPFLPKLAQKVFLSSFVILVISQLYMFDTLMMFWVTATFLLLCQYDQRKEQKTYVLLLGSMMGLGILTKGPVIFVYVIPFVVLQQAFLPSKQKIFMTYLGALGIASLIGLSWALAAAYNGGEAYAEALLWKQTAHRLINSTYHQRPWWFYGVFLPVLFIPTIFLPKFLSKFSGRLKQFWEDQTCRFLWYWIFTILILFSFISCKQIHYLFPLTPIIALLMGRYYGDAVTLTPEKASKNLSILVGISFCLVGALLPYWNERIENRLPLQALSREIKKIQQNQPRPFAFMHSLYHGEFGFLTKHTPVDHLLNTHDLNPWLDKNPTGFVMAYIPRHEYTHYKKWYAPSHHILYFQEGRGNYYVILEKSPTKEESSS